MRIEKGRYEKWRRVMAKCPAKNPFSNEDRMINCRERGREEKRRRTVSNLGGVQYFLEKLTKPRKQTSHANT